MECNDSIASKTFAEVPFTANPEIKKSITFWQLFRFSTSCELFLLFIGFTMATVKALTLPAMVIIYSEYTAMLVDRTLQVGTSSQTYALPIFGGGKFLNNATKEENNAELYNDSISYGILLTLTSIILFISGIYSVDIFNLVALRQITRMRIRLFESVMRQDIGWHDLATKQNFAQNMTDDIEKIRDGISEKVGHFIGLVMGFIVTVGISFGYGWKLTLAVSIYIPLVVVLKYFVAEIQSKLTTREQESYVGSGNLVEEVLNSIRTVISFGGEKKESERYDLFLVTARKASQRKGAFSGLSDGILKALLFFTCAGGFWYGVNLIIDDRSAEVKDYTPAILMIIFFGIIIGADNIAQTSPFLESFSVARGRATNIFKVIDTQSKIDPMSTDGKILNNGLRGDIEFTDVSFRYPSRPDVDVHSGLNITVKAGETVALVGSSGCGKSTCIHLLQRFYDPTFGSILLDDLDIRKYNIQWLRSNFAVVGQEPVLFLGSIADNIRYGKPNATQKEIETAAKCAGAHDFIATLPESYLTIIGERGSQLSGGQKQRIAIARAVIQNPKILLLDEATSALDYQSEKLIQNALDKASKGRTTIVVSHRLSAVRGADRIMFIHDGKVIEEGSHESLMQLEGMYYKMVHAGDIKIPEVDVDEKVSLKNLTWSRKSKASSENENDEKTSIQFEKRNSDAIQKTKALEAEKPTKINFFETFVRITKIARPEWCLLMLAAVCAILFGFTYPTFSVVFGEFYAALAEPNEKEVLERTAVLSISCIVIGIITGLAYFLQTYLFNYAGVLMTTRLRSMAFKSIMRQEIGWFDEETNSVGTLSARLAGDAAGVQGAIGYPLSGLIQALSTFIVAITLAFYYSWTLALVCLTTCPIIVASVLYEAKFTTATMIHEKVVIEEASRIATEAIANVRTIAGLRRETQVIERYNEEVRKVEVLIRQKLKYRGFINSSSQAFITFAYAIALCYGGVLVSHGEIAFQDIIKVSETLLYGSMMLAYSLTSAPAFTAAVVSGHRLFMILDRKPKINSAKGQEKKPPVKQLNSFQGVRYSDIEFCYPTRTDVKILNGFNLEVLQGKTVALVGHSGCGKSTCIQLLQRYYDADNGDIHINHDDIQTDFTLEDLRGKLGIVSQEPSLFERTIAENIAYGDNSRDITMAEIIAAAKSANAHSFIISLPNGYDTRMGARGTQLSGGQKQRIAIARALVRNPKVLLLDEATSALDLQSEQIVQQALDLACTGRTCIVIAHRLSTVQNADLICVLQNGRIVEQGTHHQLIAKDGIYAKLQKTQKES